MEEHSKSSNNGKKIKFKTNSIVGSKKENTQWIIFIIFLTFFLSATISVISSTLLENVGIIISFLILLIIIIIGIVFDIIGIAITTAEEAPFHSMASRKLYGAKQAIKLIRNANKASTICNDVIGDICGVISGAASSYIIITISKTANLTTSTIVGFSLTGLVAAATIGGKAIGKTFALKYNNYITYKVGIALNFVSKKK
ncbi:MAG: Mg2+ and Co2+ transporter CorB [Clostridium sp.]|nr:Mg2+ and Co2+ transporter CorB [Clostridium sp.]